MIYGIKMYGCIKMLNTHRTGESCAAPKLILFNEKSACITAAAASTGEGKFDELHHPKPLTDPQTTSVSTKIKL